MVPSDANSYPSDVTLEDVLALVYQQSGVDFSSYRRSTVERRVLARMRLVSEHSYAGFLKRLVENPDEIDRLIGHVAIKVSQFFRDTSVFDLLRDKVFSEFALRDRLQPLRLWSAGCGNGEEAYSLAILLTEMDSRGERPLSTVCASDIDGAALEVARRGLYAEEMLAHLSSELVSTHFVRHGGRQTAHYAVNDEVRSRVWFVRNNLLSATEPEPGPGFDLICCRNVLIYFSRPAQERVQRFLQQCLAPGGYLCLGEAERLSSKIEHSFETIDRKARIYRLLAGTTEDGSLSANTTDASPSKGLVLTANENR